MKPLGPQNLHLMLARRMAQATQTDLVMAMTKARLAHEDWAAMVAECRSCDWTAGCEKFLTLERDMPLQEPPDTCRNQERFMALKDALEEIEA